ncbi:low-density lipoprotein receptor-related protein 1-like, partial [Tachysurus ichikawai]
LAVDYFNERLYWADAKLSVISSVRLNGSDRVVAVSSIRNSSVCVPYNQNKYDVNIPLNKAD